MAAALPEFVEQATREVIAALGQRRSASTRTTTAASAWPMRSRRSRAGAVQVQGTINGYGERVGNCNLIDRDAEFAAQDGHRPSGSTSRSCASCRIFVDELANVPHDIRAPYVGAAAFTHKGGQHVHAVQKLARSLRARRSRRSSAMSATSRSRTCPGRRTSS